MSSGKFSSADIRGKFRGKNLGNTLSSELKGKLGAKTDMSAKGKLASELSGKSRSERKTAYKNLGIDTIGEKRIEKAITGEHEMTTMEKRHLERKEEAKKRRNVFTSRRSAEESANAGQVRGRTGYVESTGEFASGEVTTRTRVSFVGRNKIGTVSRPGMTSGGTNGKKKQPSGLGGNLGRPSNLNSPNSLGKKGGSRPMGF